MRASFSASQESLDTVRHRACPPRHPTQTEATAESIGNAICRKAGELRAAFVVLAGRQMSPLHRWLAASVTDYCVGRAPCPVLVYPKPNGKLSRENSRED